MHSEEELEKIINSLDREGLIKYLREIFKAHPQLALLYDVNFDKQDVRAIRKTALSVAPKAERLKNLKLH